MSDGDTGWRLGSFSTILKRCPRTLEPSNRLRGRVRLQIRTWRPIAAPRHVTGLESLTHQSGAGYVKRATCEHYHTRSSLYVYLPQATRRHYDPPLSSTFTRGRLLLEIRCGLEDSIRLVGLGGTSCVKFGSCGTDENYEYRVGRPS